MVNDPIARNLSDLLNPIGSERKSYRLSENKNPIASWKLCPIVILAFPERFPRGDPIGDRTSFREVARTDRITSETFPIGLKLRKWPF